MAVLQDRGALGTEAASALLRKSPPAALTPGALDVRHPGSLDLASKATRSHKKNIWI